MSALAGAAIWSGDYVHGEQYQREALNLFRATVSRNYPDHAVALAGLGNILTQRGKYAEADQTLNEALEIERNVFGPDNQRIASIEADLGALYQREGDPLRAMASTQDALRITTNRLGNKHYMTGYYLDAVADLDLKNNHLDDAENHARQALAIYGESLPARHLFVAATRQLLGEVLLRRGQLEPS